MARTIQSPGVEIKEIDRTTRPVLPTGTNVLVAGFANRGPTDEVVQITSLSEYESLYGAATTPAERYFSGTIKPLLDSPANIFTYRLPYGAETGVGFGTSYGCLAYPASGYNFSSTLVDSTSGDMPTKYSQLGVGTATDSTSADGGVVILGKPVHFELTRQEYDAILAKGKFPDTGDGTFEWQDFMLNSLSGVGVLDHAALLVLNKAQTTINQKFEGFYIGAVDNTQLNPATDFDGIRSVQTLTTSADRTASFTTLPDARLDNVLSAASDNSTTTFGQDTDSISEVMENLSIFDISEANYDDTLSLGLFRLRQSPFTPDVIKLTVNLEESYVGSFDYHRQINSQEGGQPISFNIESKESDSPNIKILVNEKLNHKLGSTYLDLNGNPKVKVRMATEFINGKAVAHSNMNTLSSGFGGTDDNIGQLGNTLGELGAVLSPADSLFPIGSFESANLENKIIGDVPKKLDRLFDTVENVELFDIDITVDGGLSTIYSSSKDQNTDGFDDTANIESIDSFRTTQVNSDGSSGSAAGQTLRSNWKEVTDRFINFAEFKRKDHLFISDLPRSIFVQGEDFFTLSDPNKNFSRDTLNPIKAFRSVNSNYAATYGQWVKVYDPYVDANVYNPFSGFAAAAMANTDSNFNPWFAPAGFTRGRVIGANDLALFPTQKQRDMLYKLNVNPVAFFPGEGFVIFGQKTLQKLPSAFDRINVRRLFLNLEKGVRNTVRFFVFEPNTLLTRTRVINAISPIFDNAKNTEGLFDYLVVCDERNNTPDVIDGNELKVDIYLKPARAAEFILVNFFATRTGTDFTELVG